MMASGERWARCNFGGRPIHPDDREIVDTFREWLATPDEDKNAPEWHEFLGINATTAGARAGVPTPGEDPDVKQ